MAQLALPLGLAEARRFLSDAYLEDLIKKAERLGLGDASRIQVVKVVVPAPPLERSEVGSVAALAAAAGPGEVVAHTYVRGQHRWGFVPALLRQWDFSSLRKKSMATFAGKACFDDEEPRSVQRTAYLSKAQVEAELHSRSVFRLISERPQGQRQKQRILKALLKHSRLCATDGKKVRRSHENQEGGSDRGGGGAMHSVLKLTNYLQVGCNGKR